MTWIKLDDNAVDHPKVAGLTDKAFRWWVRGMSYASRFLTDGVLPMVFWKQAPSQIRVELSSFGLWDWHDPDFRIHDYLSHQSSKEFVTKKRADTAARVKAHRERKGNGVTNASSNAHVTASENRDQSPEIFPPVAPQGGRRNVRREAKQIRKGWGMCSHRPTCISEAVCVEIIAAELSEKRRAS